MRIRIYDDRDRQGRPRSIKSPDWIAHGDARGVPLRSGRPTRAGSPTRGRPATSNNAIFLYDTKAGKLHQATSAVPERHAADLRSRRQVSLLRVRSRVRSGLRHFDNSWTYPNPTQLVAVPLRKDVKSPLARAQRRRDGQGATTDDDKRQGREEGRRSKTGRARPATTKTPPAAGRTSTSISTASRRAPSCCRRRRATTPICRRSRASCSTAALPRTGSGDEKSPIVYFDLEEREEKTVLDDADGVRGDVRRQEDARRAARRSSRSSRSRRSRSSRSRCAPADMEVPVDPRAEWRQMFTDAFRFERDFFYDPNMHGVDWAALRERYSKLLDDAVTRWDVELRARRVHRRAERVAHLSRRRRRGAGAAARRSACSASTGSSPTAPTASSASSRGGPWDADVRSPLDEPGVNVKEGDYVLAVNGVPLDTEAGSVGELPGARRQDRRAHGQRHAVDWPARARWSSSASTSETELRFRAWIEERRQIVDKATDGKVGYIYVQSTGVDAQNELVRQFMAQWKKDGLIIDERWNSGGQIPDRFIELLNRPIARLLGGARRRQPAVAAGRAPRAAGDADQRLERIGRRCVPVLLPRGRPRAAHRHAHVGRAHRHQRRAGARRRRRRHGADVPDVRPEGRSGSPKATASSPTSRSTRIDRARQGHRSAARARDQGSDGAHRQAAGDAAAAGLREARARWRRTEVSAEQRGRVGARHRTSHLKARATLSASQSVVLPASGQRGVAAGLVGGYLRWAASGKPALWHQPARRAHTDGRLPHSGPSLRVAGLNEDAHSPGMSGTAADPDRQGKGLPGTGVSSALPNCVVGTGAGNVT